jgi:hypothetical protein
MSDDFVDRELAELLGLAGRDEAVAPEVTPARLASRPTASRDRYSTPFRRSVSMPMPVSLISIAVSLAFM